MSINLEDYSSEINYVPDTPNLVIYEQLKRPTYHLEDCSMQIHDVVWGSEKIGDEEYDPLLMELARSDLFRRMQAIEQLTLPPEFTTIPNTAYFSRWQHIWGSLVFVRKMTRDDDRFSERERIIFQLRTLFSDVGQTAFSHLGDWIFQDGNSSEDLHDQELRSLLEECEVDKKLEPYNITLDEVVFPDVEDFVECPPPDICTDRLDYGLREVLRWVSPPSNVHLYKSELQDPKKLFHINEANMLEITNQEFAREYAKSHNLLSTEHHMQPVHRMQLLLMQTAVKSALLDGHFSDGVPLSYRPHPRDRLYGVDSDFRFAFRDWERINLSTLMGAIGLSQRQIFCMARKNDLSHTLHEYKFPDPLQPYTWQSEKYGLVAPSIELEQTDSPHDDIEITDGGVNIGLSPLKARSIDPLVRTGDKAERLSSMDAKFADYRNDQAKYMSLGYNALLLVNKKSASYLYDMFQSTNERWQKETKKPRDPKDLREIIKQAELYGAGHRLEIITDW